VAAARIVAQLLDLLDRASGQDLVCECITSPSPPYRRNRSAIRRLGVVEPSPLGGFHRRRQKVPAGVLLAIATACANVSVAINATATGSGQRPRKPANNPLPNLRCVVIVSDAANECRANKRHRSAFRLGYFPFRIYVP
jgi:hypothetical protein